MCNTGHIKKLLITSQRQVSAGIRRVTAITGNDAMSADYVANTLQQQITELSNQVGHHIGFGDYFHDVSLCWKLYNNLQTNLPNGTLKVLNRENKRITRSLVCLNFCLFLLFNCSFILLHISINFDFSFVFISRDFSVIVICAIQNGSFALLFALSAAI